MVEFVGIGVGPGDPELMTLKALRTIRQADVVSYLVNADGYSRSRQIAAEAFPAEKEQMMLPIVMPMKEQRDEANRIYDVAADTIQQQLHSGKNVVFLCEGDPLFFGSFNYLLERLQGRVVCRTVPGITSVGAAAAVLQQPLTMLTESFAVVSGRHNDEQIIQALSQFDSVAILKAGRHLQRILELLYRTERIEDAAYLENIGGEHQKITHDMADLDDGPGPYFSLFIVTQQRAHRS